MKIHYNLDYWTDEQLDTANYPYDSTEWIGNTINPDNFLGVNGYYGGLFSGGRYSFDQVLPEAMYPRPLVYPGVIEQEVGPEPPVYQNVPDLGSTALMFTACLLLLRFIR
jgi:hypothetical protein